MAEEQQAKSRQAMKKLSEKEELQEALAKAESQIRDLSLAQARRREAEEEEEQ